MAAGLLPKYQQQYKSKCEFARIDSEIRSPEAGIGISTVLLKRVHKITGTPNLKIGRLALAEPDLAALMAGAWPEIQTRSSQRCGELKVFLCEGATS